MGGSLLLDLRVGLVQVYIGARGLYFTSWCSWLIFISEEGKADYTTL